MSPPLDPRALAANAPVPAALEGLRCVAIEPGEPFWAAELGRRGAAEVLAASTPDELALDGELDLIVLSGALGRLRDPVGALQRLAPHCRGTLVVLEPVSLLLTATLRGSPSAFLDGHEGWWRPNVAGVIRFAEAGGFVLAEPRRRISVPIAGAPRWRRMAVCALVCRRAPRSS